MTKKYRIDIYNKINSGALVTGPDFQRKLVWKKQHKYAFIKTILMNFPFPEVYIASTDVDVETLQAREIVVDGQQRLTTIVDYIKGTGDFIDQKQVVSFDELPIDQKKEFLNYSITVKDLKDIGQEKIQEVFKRINSTNYSLNSNEILNAEYGGGEFSMFCKQIIEARFEPSEEITAIILDKETKSKLNNFFSEKLIFSDNDIKRMFDIQFIMLLISTYLDGKYFGRSTRINHYLEKYNVSFDVHIDVLQGLIKSIDIINNLNFSPKSYWFNKANLFTLLIELYKVELKNIELEIFESKLLELEKKVDIYFTDEDISNITDDEKKYFEAARHGSHEFAEREHRGKVIRQILADSKTLMEIKPIIGKEKTNLEILKEKKIVYTILIPTETGLKKGIMDAVHGVREFLSTNGFHDYDKQQFGPDCKIKLNGKLCFIDQEVQTDISLYRSNGRGDYRIWISELKSFANANEKLVLINIGGVLSVLNLSRFDYSEFFK